MARYVHHSFRSNGSTGKAVLEREIDRNSTDNDQPGEVRSYPTWSQWGQGTHTKTPGSWCHQQVGIYQNKHPARDDISVSYKQGGSHHKKKPHPGQIFCPLGPESPLPHLEIFGGQWAAAKWSVHKQTSSWCIFNHHRPKTHLPHCDPVKLNTFCPLEHQELWLWKPSWKQKQANKQKQNKTKETKLAMQRF